MLVHERGLLGCQIHIAECSDVVKQKTRVCLALEAYHWKDN